MPLGKSYDNLQQLPNFCRGFVVYGHLYTVLYGGVSIPSVVVQLMTCIRCQLKQVGVNAEERFWSSVKIPHPLPRHVAICMDGSRRWAAKHGIPLRGAYLRAAAATESTIASCRTIGIKALTLFAFSFDNWQRDPVEVALLMSLFEEKLRRSWRRWHAEKLRIVFVGDHDRLSMKARKLIEEVEETTARNDGLKVVWAVSYGGRQDLVRSVRKLADRVARGEVQPEAITEHHLREGLQSQTAFGDIGDPDLLIRTSGERRLSNFLLWDAAYTELYFDDVLWPDFDKRHFLGALQDYCQRERRYGK